MILAIDTAGPWVAVAVGDEGIPQAATAVAARLNHNEILAAMVHDVLRDAGIDQPRIIAVDVGPGSFTGTRVGVSFAVGLAQGWGIPVAAFSSFAVAASLVPKGVDTVHVAFPVVGAEWCRAALRRDGLAWHEESLVELDADAVSAIRNGEPLIVPWGEHADAISPPSGWNPAAALVSLAAATYAEGDDPATVRVRYVGPSQAERNFHARKQGC